MGSIERQWFRIGEFVFYSVSDNDWVVIFKVKGSREAERHGLVVMMVRQNRTFLRPEKCMRHQTE